MTVLIVLMQRNEGLLRQLFLLLLSGLQSVRMQRAESPASSLAFLSLQLSWESFFG